MIIDEEKFNAIIECMNRVEVRKTIFRALSDRPIAPADPMFEPTLSILKAIQEYERETVKKGNPK